MSVVDTSASHSTKLSGRLHTVALVDDEEWDRISGSQILVKSGKFHSVNPYASAEEALREIPGGQSQSRLRGQSRVLTQFALLLQSARMARKLRVEYECGASFCTVEAVAQ